MPRKLKPKDAFPMDRKVAREEILAVKKVMESKQLSFLSSNKIEEFENAFATYMGSKFAIAVSSGTSALHVALAAAGIGAGDEVLVTPYTFIATATAVLHQNARPIFVDIDPVTFCMDPADIERKITKYTKAIIPVHLFGHPADLERILSIAEKYNLVVIEDASQAHGAEYKGGKVGKFGLAGCFSLFESKNMMTGEGGIIITNNEEIAKQCRLIRHHGEPAWYTYNQLGYNYRITAIQAAIGIEQLKKLDKMNQGRIYNSEYLSSLLSDIPGIILPQNPQYGKHVFHAYAVKVDPKIIGLTGKELADILNKNFQITQLIYPAGLYTAKIFQERKGYGNKGCPFTCPFFDDEVTYKNPGCPNTDDISQNIIGLPNWYQLSYVELSLVAGKFLMELEKILGQDLGIEERVIGTMLTKDVTPKIYELIGNRPKVRNPLKVGVVGLGGIGQVHAVSYAASPWTELYALITRNPLTLQGAGLTFGISKLYDDYQDALNDPELKAISICVPTFVHKDYIIAAARAGKHILCEKPLLLNPNDYEDIMKELRMNNVKLMVAMICRFQPHYHSAKRVIDRHEIGSIVSIYAHRRNQSPPNAEWFWDVEKSGGIAVDLAIHDIDLICWYLGSNDPIVSVYAIGSNKVFPEIKTWDSVVITLKSRSGVLAIIDVSWANPELKDGSNVGMVINGERGKIQIDPSNQPSKKITELDGSESTFEDIDQLPAFIDQVSEFAQSILSNSEIKVPPIEGLRALKIANAALESLQTGKVVLLN